MKCGFKEKIQWIFKRESPFAHTLTSTLISDIHTLSLVKCTFDILYEVHDFLFSVNNVFFYLNSWLIANMTGPKSKHGQVIHVHFYT